MALIDSGTSLIYLTPLMFKEIQAKLTKEHDCKMSSQKFLTCPNSANLPPLNFTISGKNYTIEESEYTLSSFIGGKTVLI